MPPPPAGSEEAEPAEPLAAEVDPGLDSAIEERLRSTFAEFEQLEDVRVSVDSGVVRLEGEVLSSEARRRAEALAERVEGVAAVDNRLREVRDLDRRLASTFERLREKGLDLVSRLPLFLVALLAFLLFVLLARLVGTMRFPFDRIAANPFLADLVRQVVRGALVLAGALLALEILDATALLTALLGTAGLVGLALGFALRDTVENYIASVLLSLRQPFSPNDHVLIEGHEGKVLKLTSRATLLVSLDGNHVRIPNATVFKSVLVNYTRHPERRFDFTVGVDVEEDLVRVRAIALKALREMEGVLTEPPPQARVERLGESNVEVRFLGWIDQREADYFKVRSEALRQVKEALDAAGVTMPEPIYRVRADGAAGWVIQETDAAAAPAAGTGREAEPRAPGEPEVRATAPEPSPLDEEAATDVSPDTHLDRRVESERQTDEGGSDLLDPGAPLE